MTIMEQVAAELNKTKLPETVKVAAMAQSLLETGRGKSALCTQHNNFFGMRYRVELAQISSPATYDAIDGIGTYAHFSSVHYGVSAYPLFIARVPYRGWENHTATSDEYINFIWKSGYATDPEYPNKVKALFQEAKSYLELESEPDRPNEPMPEEYMRGITEPEFIVVKGVQFKKFGYRKEKFQGMIVHYTVSGRTAQSAKNVITYLASKGLGCMAMDEDGKIYIPENFDIFKDAAWHAGVSKWNNFTGVSNVFAGMEICCWGADTKVGPFRDTSDNENIIAGHYQQYTEAQEKSLLNFILWARSKNPEFKIENIAGHDEVRTAAGLRGQKRDPGASLSMTMPAFRKLVQETEKANKPKLA